MKHRFLTLIGMLAMAIAVAQSPAAAQAPSTVVSKKAASGTASKAAAAKSAVPRTPWGEPDIQGVWNDATSTPLQRPASVGGKDVLNDEEEAEFAKELEHNLTRDRRDGPASVDVNRAYNEHWMDARRLKVTSTSTSIACLVRRCTTSSYTGRWTSTREPAEHTCPALKKIPDAAARAA